MDLGWRWASLCPPRCRDGTPGSLPAALSAAPAGAPDSARIARGQPCPRRGMRSALPAGCAQWVAPQSSRGLVYSPHHWWPHLTRLCESLNPKGPAVPSPVGFISSSASRSQAAGASLGLCPFCILGSYESSMGGLLALSRPCHLHGLGVSVVSLF